MHRRHLLVLGLLPLLDAVPAQARGRAAKAALHRQAKRGIAVWYGDDRHGQTMANGRAFDQWAMTAASIRFPLGSRVRVTDLATHKSVLVTITDFTVPNSRVLIDLSRGAGRALGMEEKGRARVEVVPVSFDRSQARQRRSG